MACIQWLRKIAKKRIELGKEKSPLQQCDCQNAKLKTQMAMHEYHTRWTTVGKSALEIPKEVQSAGVPAKNLHKDIL